MNEREAFEAWWRGPRETPQTEAAAWEAWQARAAVEADRAQRVPDGWALVKSPITEEMHIAAAKVLTRASGLDGTPQRVLDSLLASTPAQPAQQKKVAFCHEKDAQMPTLAEMAAAPRPVERKPMTDEQAVKCIEAAGFRTWTSAHFRLARQVERHHGIKE